MYTWIDSAHSRHWRLNLVSYLMPLKFHEMVKRWETMKVRPMYIKTPLCKFSFFFFHWFICPLLWQSNTDYARSWQWRNVLACISVMSCIYLLEYTVSSTPKQVTSWACAGLLYLTISRSINFTSMYLYTHREERRRRTWTIWLPSILFD